MNQIKEQKSKFATFRTMSLLLRSLGRQSCLLRQKYCLVARRSDKTTSAYEEMSRFWTRNRALKRPMSPFLTVYKPHLAMMTSLTHRVTGVCMQVVITGTSIMLLCLPENFEYYLKKLKGLALAPVIICALKYILALPVTYHFLNGLRHLAWDAGYGFGLKTLYKSAYFVMFLSVLTSTYFVFGIKPSAM